MGSTCGSSSVSNATDVLAMSVKPGMKKELVECVICVCLARGGVWR